MGTARLRVVFCRCRRGSYTGTMRFSSASQRIFRAVFCTAAALLILAAQTPRAHAWGDEGHQMVNKLAAKNLPADVPAFLRTAAAVNEMEYLGPEPDRWRSPSEPELVAVQAPEHFIDTEEVAGSNPVVPTIYINNLDSSSLRIS